MLSSFTNDSSRWAAVSSRNPEADRCFVYCVKTTKIFCRPICPARLARRSNVEFFDDPAQAKAAGYRACKRCQPDVEQFIPKADKMIHKITVMLDKLDVGAPIPSLDRLAREAGMTKYHFHRSFKKATGLTPRDYALSKQRQQSGTDLPLDEQLHISTPSLGEDLSAFPSTVQSPNHNDGELDQLRDWSMFGWDDLLRFDAFEWPDLHSSELDEFFGDSSKSDAAK